MNRSGPSQVPPPWATAGQDEVDKYYLLVCRECKPELPMPFSSPEERGKWAAEHTRGTGHDGWWVVDQPKTLFDINCPFCRIVNGTAFGDIRRADSGTLIITPLNPVTDGHLLAIPRAHVTDAVAYPEVAGYVMKAAAYYASDKLGDVDVNFITSVGEHATQTVKHLHIHIVPRREGDGLHLPWTNREKQD